MHENIYPIVNAICYSLCILGGLFGGMYVLYCLVDYLVEDLFD